VAGDVKSSPPEIKKLKRSISRSEIQKLNGGGVCVIPKFKGGTMAADDFAVCNGGEDGEDDGEEEEEEEDEDNLAVAAASVDR
jgi:hypothetical protein